MQQPYEILLNRLSDSLDYPEMVFTRQLPLPKPEIKLEKNEIRVLERIAGLTADFKIIAIPGEVEQPAQ